MNENTQKYFLQILNNMEISINTMQEAVRYDIKELQREHRKLRKIYERVMKR